MAILLAVLFLVALLGAVVLWVLARRERQLTGLPFSARVVYADTGAWAHLERPLFSKRYGLTGKPDYIVKDKGVTIPVEVKPNRIAANPRESDVMQLAAYALLLEESYGSSPPYGLLKYRDLVFRIEFTDDLRGELLSLLTSIRKDLGAPDVPRSHSEPARCRTCGYRAECGQAF